MANTWPLNATLLARSWALCRIRVRIRTSSFKFTLSKYMWCHNSFNPKVASSKLRPTHETTPATDQTFSQCCDPNNGTSVLCRSLSTLDREHTRSKLTHWGLLYKGPPFSRMWRNRHFLFRPYNTLTEVRSCLRIRFKGHMINVLRQHVTEQWDVGYQILSQFIDRNHAFKIRHPVGRLRWRHDDVWVVWKQEKVSELKNDKFVRRSPLKTEGPTSTW